MLKISTSLTGLPRSACGGQVPTSFLEAHSHPTAGPSDTGLEMPAYLTIILLELRIIKVYRCIIGGWF